MVEETNAGAPSASDTQVGAVDRAEPNTVAAADTSSVQEPAAAAEVKDPVTGDAKPADSSTADKGAKKAPEKKLVDVLREVDAKLAGKGKSPDPTKDGTKVADPAAKAEADAKVVPDEQLPFHNHPRWKQVLGERNAFEPDAIEHRKVLGFMEANGLQGSEVAKGFEVMALIKTAPEKALVELEGWVDRLKLHLGAKLPPDLQAKVEDGSIDEATAKEVSLARNTAAQAKARVTQTDEERRAERETTHRNMCSVAVDEWSKQQAALDPDFGVKAPLVLDALKIRISDERRLPRDATEATQWAKDSLARINKTLTGRLRTATKPTPSTSAAAPTVQPKPKTTLEAIQQADRNYRRGKAA